MIQSNELAVEILLNETSSNVIGKVHTDKPLNRCLDLDTKQKEQLASQNKHYQKLLTLKAEDRSKPAHKEGDKLRSAMMHTIMKSTGYKTLQSAFLAQLKEINQRVCTKN